MADLERDWSIEDVVVAHEWLDELDRAHEVARARAEQNARER